MSEAQPAPADICGVSKSLAVRGDTRWAKKWGTRNNPLTYWISDSLPGLAASAMWVVADSVYSEISTICNLNFARARGARSANILITAFGHDGPGGVLADAQLGHPNMTQSLQRYDLRERRWSNDFSGGGIPFKDVLMHESGHSLGLVHDSPRADALMAPSLSKGGWRPRDIDRLVKLYGPPESPLPNPSNPDEDGSTIGIYILNAEAIRIKDERTGEDYEIRKPRG